MGDTPNCACHDEPMIWNKDSRRKRGGFWKCSVKMREYNHSPAGHARYLRYYRANKRHEHLARATRRRTARIHEIEEALA